MATSPYHEVLKLRSLGFAEMFAPGDRNPLYFNTAGSAQVPRPLGERIDNLREWFDREGPFGRETNRVREDILVAARGAVAGFLGAHASEVAITSNATEATVALLTALNRGRITTLLLGEAEHPSTSFPGQALATRGIDVVPLGEIYRRDVDPQRTLALVAATSYKTGRNISNKALAALRKARIPVIFDITQSIGLNGLPPRLLKMPNCVAAFGSCHKWMHCPQGTGFLVVKAAHGDLFPNPFAGWRQIDQITDEFVVAADARRFEGGTVDFASIASVIPMFARYGNPAFAAALQNARAAKTNGLLKALRPSNRFNVVTENAGFVVLAGTGEPWDGFALTEHVFRETGCDTKPFSPAECPGGAVRISLSPFNRDADIAALGAAVNRFFAWP